MLTVARPTTLPRTPSLPPTGNAVADSAIRHLRGATEEHEFTGGDGTYSIPLGPNRTAWVFGDSFVGGVLDDGSRSNDFPRTFVRNSIVLQDGDAFRVVTAQDGEVRLDAARPPGMRENRDGTLPDEWYWPGHGTTDGDELHIFMHRFRHPHDSVGGATWDWMFQGTDLATFDARTGVLLNQTRLFDGGDVHWGAAVLDRGPYSYVYGARMGEALLARTLRGELDIPESWEFWNGARWTPDARSAVALDGPRVSNQFGVVAARDGGVLLVAQHGMEQAIRAWHAPSPEGHFSGGDIAADIPVQPNGRHVYNAVPHPQFSDEEGDLLVSYNVGGIDFMDDHTSYRPGFLEIPAARLPGGGVAALDARMGDAPAVS